MDLLELPEELEDLVLPEQLVQVVLQGLQAQEDLLVPQGPLDDQGKQDQRVRGETLDRLVLVDQLEPPDLEGLQDLLEPQDPGVQADRLEQLELLGSLDPQGQWETQDLQVLGGQQVQRALQVGENENCLQVVRFV